MSVKTDFVTALLTCCSRVYVASQAPTVPQYPLILYEQTQCRAVLFADNSPLSRQNTFWVYLYAHGSLDTLEAATDAALSGYAIKLIRETTEGDVTSKIKEYTIYK